MYDTGIFLTGLLYDTGNFLTGDALEYFPTIWNTENGVEEFIELVETNRLPSEGAPKIFYNEVIMRTILELLDPKTDVVSIGMAFKVWSTHFFRICKIKEVLIFPKGLNEGPSYLVFMIDSSADTELSLEERRLCQQAASTDMFGNPMKIYENRSRLPNAFVAVRKDKTGFAFGDAASGGDARRFSKQLKNINSVFSTVSAFLIVKFDRSMLCWGNAEEGGKPPEKTRNVKQVKANTRAFCILYDDGSVAAIGSPQYGGLLHKELNDILDLECNERAFWALKEDGSIETWGDPSYQYRDNKQKIDFDSLLTHKIS